MQNYEFDICLQKLLNYYGRTLTEEQKRVWVSIFSRCTKQQFMDAIEFHFKNETMTSFPMPAKIRGHIRPLPDSDRYAGMGIYDGTPLTDREWNDLFPNGPPNKERQTVLLKSLAYMPKAGRPCHFDLDRIFRDVDWRNHLKLKPVPAQAEYDDEIPF